LRNQYEGLFDTVPDEDALLAIAQHYGFPTPLLDYTHSLRVAAFFATLGARRLSPKAELIGVIYHMNPTRLEFRPATDPAFTGSIGLPGFSLLDEARIRAGMIRFVAPHLPDAENRIARQQGIFVAGYQTRDLQGVAIDRIYFRQAPGEVFEDPTDHISEAYLLPDDSRMAQLAVQVKERFRARKRRKLLPELGATRLPENSLLGSDGSMLYAQVRDAKAFFDSLHAQAQVPDRERFLEQLGKVFSEYFRNSRSCADVGEVPTGDDSRPALDPLAMAVDALATLTGADKDQLWEAVEPQLPQRTRAWNTDQARRRQARMPINPRERIALACAFYLAGWEHLQYVKGAAARTLAHEAQLILQGISSPVEEQR